MRSLAVAVALSFAASHAVAVEGMWQPHQLPAIEAQLKAAGIAVDPKALKELTQYPMNAIVGLGFCTASFVSPMGLVVTNHHCAYGSIQFNSTAEKNLLRDGFLAANLGDELPGEPTLRVYVTESITEVTDKVRADLSDTMSGRQRFDAIDKNQKALVAECEATKGFRCDVYVFHGGASYFLIRQMEIRDVRLVYAPAEAIGKFGGDIDNWMWPRHTGDFAYYRAYVGPDGQPADFNEANVPYRPRSHLKVQPAGVKEGDFAMIAGYPGRTNRYRLSEEVGDVISWGYPTQIQRFKDLLAIIDRETKDRPDAAIKYAGAVAGLNNGLKNFEGNLEGFAKIDGVGIKQAEEQAIIEWAKTNDPAGVAGFDALKSMLAQTRARRDRDQLLGLMAQSGALTTAQTLYRLAVERRKPNAEREVGFQERDEIRIEGRLKQLDRRYDPQTDRALLTYVLGEYLKLPAEQRVAELDRWMGGDESPTSALLNERLDDLYAKTKVGDLEQRLKWFKADLAALDAESDPLIAYAKALFPASLRLENERKSIAGDETRHRPAWMATRIAYAKAQGRVIYPDANNSLRVTFGNVMGYRPRDGVSYAPFTYLDGIVEKHTGKDPFDATQRQLKAIADKRFGPYAVDGRVPVNFLADLDITGGNSGSPMLNARAELIGLAFDGNYEAISSGWIFNEELTRTIGVDVRYMLWVMDAIDGAHRLLEEMGIKPAFAE